MGLEGGGFEEGRDKMGLPKDLRVPNHSGHASNSVSTFGHACALDAPVASKMNMLDKHATACPASGFSTKGAARCHDNVVAMPWHVFLLRLSDFFLDRPVLCPFFDRPALFLGRFCRFTQHGQVASM